MSVTKERGAIQETRVLQYLLRKGWKLIQKNYRTRAGEIDLIFQDPEKTIIFVEVRYRHRADYGSAQSSVTFSKQFKIIKTALQFIKEKKLAGFSFRFDVAGVSRDGIEYIPNAFTAEGYTL